MKPLLDLAALILSLINGLMLLRGYLRDRAVLKVKAVHPNVYQWFFRLPSREHKGQPTRRYGFLAYIGISNRGRRDVAINAWRLRGRTKGWRKFERVALSIPEPQSPIGESLKIFPVLGTKGVHFDGETMVKSGASISGFCYYVVEFFGNASWDIQVHNGTTDATIVVRNVFDQTATVRLSFKELSLEKVNGMIPNIASIDASNSLFDPLSPAPIADSSKTSPTP